MPAAFGVAIIRTKPVAPALITLGNELVEIALAVETSTTLTYSEPIPESTFQTKSSKPKQGQSFGKRRLRKPL